MKRFMLTLLMSALMISAFAGFAGAFTMAEKVVVSNELVAISRVSAGGYTPQERIDRINDRLNYILGFEALTPQNVRAIAIGNMRVIMVGSTPLMTVTPRDAEANNSTVPALTRVWLQNIRDVLPLARPFPEIPG